MAEEGQDSAPTSSRQDFLKNLGKGAAIVVEKDQMKVMTVDY